MSTPGTPSMGESSALTPRTAGPLEEKGRDLGRKADELGERLQSGIHDQARKLDEAGRHVQEKLAAAGESAAGRARDGQVRLEREVQEHPFRSLLSAFGAGAIVGMLLGRRWRR